MKVLKVLGIIIIALMVLVIVIGLISPNEYDVKREVLVNAPVDVVFANISTHANFIKWSPWQQLDPNVKTTFEGTDGTVGAKYSWEGNNEVGAGSMTITKVEPNVEVEQDLQFLKPFKSQAFVYTRTKSVPDGTQVTWGMRGESDFMSRVFMTLMGGMDKAIGKDYEKGLANLKAMCESAPMEAFPITEVDWEGKTCLSIRKVVGFNALAAFFGEHYPKMYGTVTKTGGQPGIPLGVYYKYDEVAMTADVAAAIPYTGKTANAPGYAPLDLPAGKAYLINYFGDYAKMKPAYEAMDAKLKTLGKTNPEMVVEEYVSDPMTEKDTAKWNTKIYFFVK